MYTCTSLSKVKNRIKHWLKVLTHVCIMCMHVCTHTHTLALSFAYTMIMKGIKGKKI